MYISIFGLGYVGCISLGCLSQNGHHVIGVDVSEVKVNQINKGLATIVEKDIDRIIKEQHEKGRICATQNYIKAILETEISIVAVGTPSTERGHLNLDYIFKLAEDFADALREKTSFHIIAIRSTVLPGTCEKFAEIIEERTGKRSNIDFAVVDNPEFLREGSAVSDFYNPPYTLIGSNSKFAAKKLAELYKDLPGEIIFTDVRVAEIMKYVNNTFHALKISFANEIGNICSAMEIDSHKVMEIFCKDRQLNIYPYYLKPGFAYGGSCLPKDLMALQTLAHDEYIKTPLIDSIDKTNDIQIQRAINLASRYYGKKIAVLGLTFKAGTDDLRNSPNVELVETLLGKGYYVRIYDNNINMARLTGKNKEYIERHIPHLACFLTNDLENILRENEVIVVCNKEKQVEEALKNVSDKVIIDMVRLPQEIRINNTYIGINWVINDEQVKRHLNSVEYN